MFRPRAKAHIWRTFAVRAKDIHALISNLSPFIHHFQRSVRENAAEHFPIGFKARSPGGKGVEGELEVPEVDEYSYSDAAFH